MGGYSRGECLGASSTDNGMVGREDSSSISSHSRKGIYFLMALALSQEAGTLSFKGTESSLLPRLAGL